MKFMKKTAIFLLNILFILVMPLLIWPMVIVSLLKGVKEFEEIFEDIYFIEMFKE